MPFVVDYNDGTKPVGRAVSALTPEGHAVCGGSMPVGATLAIGGLNADDVLSTTEKTIEKTLGTFAEENNKNDNTVLIYSCMSRYLALGVDNTAEVEKAGEILGDTSYLFSYSAGEICPLPSGQGSLKNYFHNYTAVFCKLR
jgi:hypothetical protein